MYIRVHAIQYVGRKPAFVLIIYELFAIQFVSETSLDNISVLGLVTYSLTTSTRTFVCYPPAPWPALHPALYPGP